MENSSTSNSDVPESVGVLGRRAWLITVLAALCLVVTAEAVASLTAAEEPSPIEKLNQQPGDDVFVFGNSMFQTGIDFTSLGEATGRDIVFDYHNGHYTNLWYLIADQALPQADPPPNLVVWGFRPAFAAEPAFRGNAENDNDLFHPGDDTYRSLTIGTARSARVVGRRGSSSRSGHHVDWAVEPSRSSPGTSCSGGHVGGIDVVGVLRPEETASFRERFASGEVTVTDEILRIATGGEIQLAEERVVDGQGDFIRGPILPFADTFVPRIVDKIDEAGLDQLVVIWRPVTTVNGSDTARDDTFVADTIEYLESAGIDYLDLYNDDRIVLEMFASGDHYNAEGREFITGVLAEALSR